MFTELSFKLFKFFVFGLAASLLNILACQLYTLLLLLFKHILHLLIQPIIHIHMQIFARNPF